MGGREAAPARLVGGDSEGTDRDGGGGGGGRGEASLDLSIVACCLPMRVEKLGDSVVALVDTILHLDSFVPTSGCSRTRRYRSTSDDHGGRGNLIAQEQMIF